MTLLKFDTRVMDEIHRLAAKYPDGYVAVKDRQTADGVDTVDTALPLP